MNEQKIRIQKAREELANMGSSEQPMPEMINTTNVLRANEHLIKIDQAKTNLISTYEQYTKQLEDMAASLLSIQSDLKDIVKAGAAIIENAPRKKARKKKPSKKTRKFSKKRSKK
ncbi:MAG: hypothetical protein ACREAX_04025 [Candidatus Nitrosotenuis sp.]